MTVKIQSRSQSPPAFLSVVGHLGKTLGQWNESVPGFLAQNNRSLHGTASQEKHILFDFPRVSPGDQPLTKRPEDSGIEIGQNMVAMDFTRSLVAFSWILKELKMFEFNKGTSWYHPLPEPV